MFALLTLLLVSGSQLKTMGIMSAMEIELEYISQDMAIERTGTIAQNVYKTGTVNNIRCIVVHGGVGKVGAAYTAQTLIMHYDVDDVLFTGVAGGINPELRIGDIVIAENIVYHDFSLVQPDQFIPFDTVGFFADSALVALALQATENVELEVIPEKIRGEETLPRITVGRIATGDQFISSESKRVWIEKVFRADCVEMEGATVAQTCTVNRVPFAIIRSLSDLANEDAEVDFESFVICAAKNSSLLVKEMLRLLAVQ